MGEIIKLNCSIPTILLSMFRQVICSTDIKAIVQEEKIKYEDVRNSIRSGKQERYTKVLALLYVQEKNGSITFHDPYQELYDFVLK
ncbi:MAG: hypothetical protein NTX22_08690 [Ignavibacteriales bacterium]|nr:hypothetical protein [Ignavibacteriales bacterium]